MEETAAVMEMVTRCIAHMRANGIDQWDRVYPARADIDADAAAGNLFVAREGPTPVGMIVLNEEQAPEYAPLAWSLADPRPLVIHRLCVRPDWQGQGIAHRLMDFAEDYAARNGYRSVRLDTYLGNPRALALYRNRGYREAGMARFPRRSRPFICCEKVL